MTSPTGMPISPSGVVDQQQQMLTPAPPHQVVMVPSPQGGQPPYGIYTIPVHQAAAGSPGQPVPPPPPTQMIYSPQAPLQHQTYLGTTSSSQGFMPVPVHPQQVPPPSTGHGGGGHHGRRGHRGGQGNNGSMTTGNGGHHQPPQTSSRS